MSYIEIFGTLKDASFNGTNLSTKYFYIYDIKKPLMPQQSLSTIDIPKRPGSIISSKKFKQNSIILYGFMECSSYDDLITKCENLSAFLYSDSDKQLISSKQSDRYWNVQYLNYDVIELKDTYALVNLEFTCNDPLAYDTTADTDTQTITVNDTSYTLANSGHYYAYPVINITFNDDQTHVYVANLSISENRFDISKPFVSGDVLIVDCKNGTIKLNGSTSMAGFGDGGLTLAEYILLGTGNNTISVGSSDATINVTVLISFNKTYLY
jgi:predicted phage tail component-like protein